MNHAQQTALNCRVCEKKDLSLVLDLGMQPWCNNFLSKEQLGKEPVYPLRLTYCQHCATPQLDYTVPKEVMFGNHTYLSGVTKTLSQHFLDVAIDVDNRYFKDVSKKSVVDIGSNDGTQLQHYKKLGYDILGIESSKLTAEIAEKNGINTLNAFFNYDLAKNLGRKFNLINAAGVFFHLEELHSVIDGVREILEKNGIFIVQFLYMRRILENNAFDQIYHEHLLFYNVQNLNTLLKQHGLMLFDAYESPIHGGSVIGFVCHDKQYQVTDRLSALMKDEIDSKCNDLQTYQDFAERVQQIKNANLNRLHQWKNAGKKVIGYGAPVKGNTMLNYFGVNTSLMPTIVEINPLRDGLYTPGTHIPILLESKLSEKPDVYYVFAWNFKDEIVKKNKNLIESGVEFYFPIEVQKK